MSDICRCSCSNRGRLGFYVKNKITFGTCSVPFLYSSPLLLPFLHYLSHTIQYIPIYSFLPFFAIFCLIWTLFYFYWAFLSLLCIIFGHVCTLFCLFFIIFCHVCDLLVWSLFLLFLSSPWTTFSPDTLSLISMNYILTRHVRCTVHTVCRLASIIT